MNIVKYLPGQAYGNMYGLEENNHLIFIDPGIVDIDLSGRTLDYILLTHEHYDHISGVNYWKEKTGAKVICNERCADAIEKPTKNLSFMFREFCEIQAVRKITEPVENLNYRARADITFEDTYGLEWQGNKIKIFATPGHSAGSEAILVNGEKLFSGDSLFKDYPVTGIFPGSNKQEWLETGRPRLRELRGNIKVYPGHFEEFYLKEYTLWDKSVFLRLFKAMVGKKC